MYPTRGTACLLVAASIEYLWMRGSMAGLFYILRGIAVTWLGELDNGLDE